MDSVTLPLPALPSATHRPLWNPRAAVAGFRCFHSSAPLSRLRGSPLLASNTLTANSVPPKSGVYTVGDFMTKKEDLHVVKPTTTVDEALEALVEHRITGFPVIDDNWKLVGVVSDYDLLALDSISGQGQKDTSMFPEVDSTWKGKVIVSPYKARKASRLGAYIEYITFTLHQEDEWELEPPAAKPGLAPPDQTLRTFNEVQKLLSKTNGKVIGELMTTVPMVVRETTNLEDAARLLLETKFRRLPVVDAEGRLVGIITRGNVVGAALHMKRDSQKKA